MQCIGNKSRCSLKNTNSLNNKFFYNVLITLQFYDNFEYVLSLIVWLEPGNRPQYQIDWEYKSIKTLPPDQYQDKQ